MKKSELRQLIKESLNNKYKLDSCNCGCNVCENTGNKGVILNENIAPIQISENIKYHINNRLPLTENTFRYGSDAFLDLWKEARHLYSRNAIHVNESDKEILMETNLGEYGIYEGQKVPLDMPMVDENTDEDKEDNKTWSSYEQKMVNQILRAKKDGTPIFELPMKTQDFYRKNKDKFTKSLNEAEFKGKDVELNKPKRGGSKKFYVYVRDPKTKKVKKVSFGDSGGLSTKVNDPKARKAFAARHDCKNKKDRTSAGWWSCNLPKYAKLLGIKSTFTGYW
jgi:hypothetical protein